MDLVSINKSYVFSDPELDSLIFPLVSELSKAVNKPMEIVSSFLLWPKYALRSSLDTLNGAGPMGISRYGVNRPIIEGMSFPDKDKIEFEFIVNSDQIHLAHALDATYFPFFVEDGKYTDHPYALMMGNMLNFYKTYNYKCMSEFSDLELSKTNGNPSIQLISTFDINDYISIREFEKEISSSIIRQGMNSLFSELAALDEQARGARVSEYNIEVEKALNRQGVVSHALDLAEDAAGLVFTLPGATGKKLLKTSVEKAREKFLVIQEVLEFIEDKRLPKDDAKRNISLLTQVNRVARLKKKYE